MSAKAKNLGILSGHGIPVPRGFVLSEDQFARNLPSFAEAVISALPDSNRAAAIILDSPIAPETEAAISAGLSNLPEVQRFAVRSSGQVFSCGEMSLEDGDQVSMAGQFNSYLNVPRGEVLTAVKRCWASLYNARSLDRFKADAPYVRKSRMSVIVQEMVPAKASVVMMTVDTMGTGETGSMEFAWGPCEAIVSGMVSPDEAIFDRASGTVVSVSVGPKEVKVAYSDFSKIGDNVRRVPTTAEEQGTLALPPTVIHRLMTLGCEIERLFGRPQDIEAVVDFDGRIVVTQTRSVTCLPPNVAQWTSCQVGAAGEAQ